MREIIILGDIEMGGGTLTDDFIADKSLTKLINNYARKKHPVELILNGDTFDFLKCPLIENNVKSYPRHITAQISLAKLNLIYDAHTGVFEALKKFVRKKSNVLNFIIGNHDHDLFFKEVQKEIKKKLASRKNVTFKLFYKKHGIYCEHGQQYDFLNRINKKKPLINYKGKKILNIPWLSIGIISNFLTLKEEHPFLERIFPRPLLFTRHKDVIKKLSWRSVDFMFKSMIYYPIRYFGDSTYLMPRALMRELYRRFRKVHWDVDSIVAIFKRKRRRLMKKHKVHVLGHVHQNYFEEKSGWVLIHPDTWRDEYKLDSASGLLTPKIKKYVKINVEDNTINYNLIEWPMARKAFKFEEVVADEKKYVELAAKLENYKLTIFTEQNKE
jgi:UDP-2,3-diacylglucosamine pyrophosphatase LpxH